MKISRICVLPAALLLIFGAGAPLCAQDTEAETSVSRTAPRGVGFHVAADLVSSYIWRGMYQTTASLQPTLSLSAGNFSLTAWGSTTFTDNGAKEIDLTAAYRVGRFTIAVADLWWGGQGSKTGYFNYESRETEHHFEGTLACSVSDRFPLSIAWNTLFAGQDKNAEGEQAYSTYVELNYPFAVKGIDLNAACGFTPWDAPQYGTSEFAVTNLALKAGKTIRITKSFSLPLFTQVILNPAKNDVYFVAGITLR